eukprot:CAMPEP_0174365068 /NCGR_PEP_ID=MMETSP0811_2-20130205/75698_1 /TAXON_ID=73025 ORGANISM="Eutreptiella gymnastica-like, Strain CCMP1594" /NCGR_SAMPLE_ID=MMETSP0811_2 /ASSEMBLY_ACC=CAM_ASM_000667 /LENGTH=87 /DNA_ID=CAMNT_0015505363 /DNA_START=466 /DNA_END=729 /DNA_ORIENTATION=-
MPPLSCVQITARTDGGNASCCVANGSACALLHTALAQDIVHYPQDQGAQGPLCCNPVPLHKVWPSWHSSPWHHPGNTRHGTLEISRG